MKEGGGAGEGSFLPFFPTLSPFFYLRHLSRGLWLSFLVLCSWTAQKRLLRRARVTFSLKLLHVEWDRTFSVYGASENSGW